MFVGGGYSNMVSYGIIKSPLIDTTKGKLVWYQFQSTTFDPSDVEYYIKYYDENNNLISDNLYYSDTTTSSTAPDSTSPCPGSEADADMNLPAIIAPEGGPAGYGNWYKFANEIPDINTNKFRFEIHIFQWEAPNKVGDGDPCGSWFEAGFDNFYIDPDTSSASLVDAMDTSGTSWTTGGNANWFGQTSTSYHDGDAAQSGSISHSQNSWLQTTGIWVFPGTWSFYWKVSSEENGDWLEFYIDDVRRDRISGTVDWQQKSYSISSGSHTLKWQYVKDDSIDSEYDCGWLDKVEFSHESIIPPTPLFYVDKVATSSEVAYTELIWNPSGITNYYGYAVHLTNPDLVVSTSNDYKIGYFAPIEYEEENLEGTLMIWAGTTVMDIALGGPYLSFLHVVWDAFHNEDKIDVHKAEAKEFLREELIIDHKNRFVDSNNEVRFITQIVSDTPTQNWQIHVRGSIDYDYVWDSSYQGTVVDPPSRHGTLSQDEVITLIE